VTPAEHAALAGDDEQRAEESSGEAAQVSTKAYPSHAKTEGQVDQDENANGGGQRIDAAAAGDDEGRRQDPEHGAGRTEGEAVRSSEERTE